MFALLALVTRARTEKLSGKVEANIKNALQKKNAFGGGGEVKESRSSVGERGAARRGEWHHGGDEDAGREAP